MGVKFLIAGSVSFHEEEAYSAGVRRHGWVVVERSALDELYGTPSSLHPQRAEPSVDERLFPYLAYMLKASREISFSPGERTPKKSVESWLRSNWPPSLGEVTDSKVKSMATFLRRPEHEGGGLHGPSTAAKVPNR